MFCGFPHLPHSRQERCAAGGAAGMRAGCRAACAPPEGNEPNQGYPVTVVCLGVTLRIFANQSENKGFRDKTCSSTSTVVEN